MLAEIHGEPGGEWNNFAEAAQNSTLGHDSAWARVLNRAYRLEPIYLSVREAGGELRGVLPLVMLPRPFGGGRLVSLPYLDSAGILASDGAAESALLEAAQRIARERGARALEIRNAEPLRSLDEALPPQNRVNLVLGLETTVEAQWQGLRAKVRNQTRKAEREGLSIAEGSNADLLDAFYSIFCINMRDLGSPVHARRFFAEIASAFGERLRIIVVQSEGRPIGGLMALRRGRTVHVPWASTLRSERARCPNNLIYWEALRWAVEVGASRFDFGRSPLESGTYRFKRGWGAEEEPMAWMTFGPDGRLETPSATGENRRLQQLSSIWTRLPVSLANRIGPPVRRYFAN